MTDCNIQIDIIKQLGDNRSKLSALFSLYNTSLITAEASRGELTVYYEQMIDFKNDLSNIASTIVKAGKGERDVEVSKSQSKINKIERESNKIRRDFADLTNKYRNALQECGSLKTEYKHEICELCKEFKSNMGEDTPQSVVKSYKQQVKVLKSILDRIEQLVADYNVKRNKVEKDNESFNELYSNVHALVIRLQA